MTFVGKPSEKGSLDRNSSWHVSFSLTSSPAGINMWSVSGYVLSIRSSDHWPSQLHPVIISILVSSFRTTWCKSGFADFGTNVCKLYTVTDNKLIWKQGPCLNFSSIFYCFCLSLFLCHWHVCSLVLSFSLRQLWKCDLIPSNCWHIPLLSAFYSLTPFCRVCVLDILSHDEAERLRKLTEWFYLIQLKTWIVLGGVSLSILFQPAEAYIQLYFRIWGRVFKCSVVLWSCLLLRHLCFSTDLHFISSSPVSNFQRMKSIL